MRDRPTTAAVPDTLGTRLSELGRRLATRHRLARPWHAPLRSLLARAAELAGPSDGRFDRVEPGGARPATPIGVPPASGAARWPRGLPAASRGMGGSADQSPASRVGPPDGEVHVTGQAVDGVPASAIDHSHPDGEHLSPALSSGLDSGLDSGLASGTRRLPADVRASVRALAGPGADAMVIHDDAAADALTRRHRADAVTVGRHVHLRAGHYRPDTAEGFGVLAHEAAHVTAGGALGTGHRATPGGRSAEEAVALEVELTARRAFGAGRLGSAGPSGPPARGGPSGPAVVGAADPLGQTHVHAMTARTDRDLDDAPGLDLDRLRHAVIEDVMRRLRTEFERGG